MGIVIKSCVTGMHGMCLYSYLLCMHTLSTHMVFFKCCATCTCTTQQLL